jgi:uncharacterized membrane protein
MKSVARIGKQPLHPILVVIPIVCWLITFGADIVYSITHGNTAYVTAFVAMLAGVLSSGLALGAGLLDYFGAEMSAETYHVATFHLLLNLMAVTLYIINLGYRSTYTSRVDQDPLHWGIAFLLELAALGLVMLSGLLGRRVAHGPGGVLDDTPATTTTGRTAAPRKSGRH